MSTAVMTAPAHATHGAAKPRRREFLNTTRQGMWWFLGSEVGTFGGIVTAYIMYRLRHTEWITQTAETMLPIGIINTIVLLTSSYTMVLAHHAAEVKDAAKAGRYLWYTIILGALFLVFKSIEYTYGIHHGHLPDGTPLKMFWSFYFGMTGLHCLHIIVGLLMMLLLQISLKQPQVLNRVQAIGLYWHFVDIVWIVLFPLLYVTGH